MLEKTLESPMDRKAFKPVNLKGNQPLILIGRTDAKAEAPILWPPDAKNWLIGKEPEAGKDWRQEKVTKDEMVGWHHQFNGHEFKQTPGDSEGQGSLVCISPWGHEDQRWLSNWKTTTAHWQQSFWGVVLICQICSVYLPSSHIKFVLLSFCKWENWSLGRL